MKAKKTLNFNFHAEYVYGWFLLFMAGFFHNGVFLIQRILLEKNLSYPEIFCFSGVFSLIVMLILLFTIYPQQIFGNTVETFGWTYSHVWMNSCFCCLCWVLYLIGNEMIGFGDSMAIYVCSGTIYICYYFFFLL